MTQDQILTRLLGTPSNDDATFRRYMHKADMETLRRAIEEMQSYEIIDTNRIKMIKKWIKYKENTVEIPKQTDSKEADKSDAISNAIHNAVSLMKSGLEKPVRDNEELLSRIVEFLSVCEEEKQLPTVEKMLLAIGYLKKTIDGWYAGNTKGNEWVNAQTLEIIEFGKQTIAAIDSELVQTGKTKEISWVYRSKNFYGMTDEGQKNAVAEETSSATKEQLEAAAKMLMMGEKKK